MSVSTVDLTDPATFADGPPHDFLARLRSDAPVWRHPATEHLPAFWVVTRYDDVHEVLLPPGPGVAAVALTSTAPAMLALP